MVSLLLIEFVIASCLGLFYILVFSGRRGKNLPPGMTPDMLGNIEKLLLMFLDIDRSSNFTVDRQSSPAPQEWSPFQVRPLISQTVELQTLTAEEGLPNGPNNMAAYFLSSSDLQPL